MYAAWFYSCLIRMHSRCQNKEKKRVSFVLFVPSSMQYEVVISWVCGYELTGMRARNCVFRNLNIANFGEYQDFLLDPNAIEEMDRSNSSSIGISE